MLDTSLPESLTREASRTCDQPTSTASRAATFSPASEVGTTLLLWPDIQPIKRSGLGVARASLSARQAKALGLLTSGIYGLVGFTSSGSAGLQSCLESRLRLLLHGSDLCAVIWKPWDTPWGQCLSKPRALAPRIDVTGSGGLLPTPSGTSNHGKSHVSGRIDEWGGSSNYFRGTADGNKHLPGFELWTMGYPDEWRQLMPPATPSSRKSRQSSSGQR